MTRLESFGWHHYLHRSTHAGNADEKTARIVAVKGLKYHLATENGELDYYSSSIDPQIQQADPL